MATDVERLQVLIEANTAQYAKAMSKLQRDTNRAIGASTKSVKALDSQLKTMSVTASRAMGALGITLGVGGIMQLASSARTAIGELGDLADAAQRAGVSAEKLQVFRFALGQAGGEATDADAALAQFNRRMGEIANTGKGAAAAAIETLGIKLEDATGRMLPTEQILAQVIEKLSGVNDQARVAALAGDLFGDKLGPKLLGLLTQGNRGLQDTEDRMRSLGKLISDEMVAKGDELDDRFADWADTLDKQYKRAVVGAADAIWYLVDSLRAVENQTNLDALRDELEATASQWQDIHSTLADAREFREGLSDAQAGEADAEIVRLEARAEALQRTLNVINQRMLDLQTGGSTKPAFLETELDGLGCTSSRSAPVPRIRPEIDQTTASVRELDNMIDKMGQTAANFASGFISDLRAGKNAAEALGGVLSNVADQLLSSGIQMLVSSVLGGGLGGGGGFLAGLFGRAGGGHVGAGRPHVVGERGPELFVPNTSGRIVANGAGAGGVNRIVVEFQEGPAFGGVVRSISGPQAQQISVSVVAANDRGKARQAQLSGD